MDDKPKRNLDLILIVTVTSGVLLTIAGALLLATP